MPIKKSQSEISPFSLSLVYGKRFLFIKEVRSLSNSPPRLEAIHNFGVGGDMGKDHFVSKKVYPGIFVLEGCAQAAVCLYQKYVRALGVNEVPLLAHANTRFKKPVQHTAGLVHIVELVKAVGTNAIIRGISQQNDSVVMECELGLAVRNIKKFR